MTDQTTSISLDEQIAILERKIAELDAIRTSLYRYRWIMSGDRHEIPVEALREAWGSLSHGRDDIMNMDEVEASNTADSLLRLHDLIWGAPESGNSGAE